MSKRKATEDLTKSTAFRRLLKRVKQQDEEINELKQEIRKVRDKYKPKHTSSMQVGGSIKGGLKIIPGGRFCKISRQQSINMNIGISRAVFNNAGHQ